MVEYTNLGTVMESDIKNVIASHVHTSGSSPVSDSNCSICKLSFLMPFKYAVAFSAESPTTTLGPWGTNKLTVRFGEH